MKSHAYFRFDVAATRGFTLLELMVVLVLIVGISSITIFNLGSTARGETARDQVIQSLISEIRSVQSRSLSGATHGGVIVCGYGMHQIDAHSYRIYAKEPIDAGTTCEQTLTQEGTNYAADDITIKIAVLSNPQAQIVGNFYDIFFKIPGASTYVNGLSGPNVVAATIAIAPAGALSNTRSIGVFPSGRIDIDP